MLSLNGCRSSQKESIQKKTEEYTEIKSTEESGSSSKEQVISFYESTTEISQEEI